VTALGPAGAPDPTAIRFPEVERARDRVRHRYYERSDVQEALIDALLEDLVRA
jgi:hypothetical protein